MAPPADWIYADQADLTRVYDVRVLVQLTNDDDRVDPDNVNNMVTEVLMEYENQAAFQLTNYFRDVYLMTEGELFILPVVAEAMDPKPSQEKVLTRELLKLNCDLTWFGLWDRRASEPEYVTSQRERVMTRLEAMVLHSATETRGPRKDAVYPIRNDLPKVRTMFDQSGYFDGLIFPGRRVLAGDRDNRGRRG